MDQYECDKYVTNVENLKQTLHTYGVAIIPSVLSPNDCVDMQNGMWDYLEHVTKNFNVPIKRNDQKSWLSFSKLYPLHSMLLQRWGIGHAQFIWDLRQNIKIVDIFAKLWNVEHEELLVSFDGASFHFPPEKTKKGWFRGNNWLHTDQSYLRNEFECIQSWVTAYDVNEGDATLTLLEKSHQYHADFAQKFVTNSTDWFKLENDVQYNFYVNEKNCIRKSIKCPAGSLVLWDSRTIHMGQEPLKERLKDDMRCVVYLCYTPRYKASKANIAKKIKALKELRTTNHWAHNPKLFPVNPRTYGNELPKVELIPNPVLNELGMYLSGL